MSTKNLPKAIRNQVEAANALEQSMNAPQPSQGPQVVPLAQAAAEPQVAPPEPPVARQEPPPAPVVEPQRPAPQTEDWEHKYRTLVGMTSQQMSELTKRANAAEASRQDLIRQMEELKRAVEAAKTAKPTIDPKDVETFGADLVDMVRRQASVEIEQAVSRALGDLVQRVNQLETSTQGVSQAVTQTAEQSFFSSLAHSVPDWEAVNSNPKFHEWLSQVDPVYGEPRQKALTIAREAMAVGRVVAIFNAFKATMAAPQPTNEDLQAQVAPARSASAPAPVEQGAQYVSGREVTQFYEDLRRGRYRGKEAEANRIEAVINAAIAAGRVTA